MASLGMTSLPSGLASISSRMDDAPNVRGAVAFGRMAALRREHEEAVWLTSRNPAIWSTPQSRAELREAIDRHAALAYRLGIPFCR